MSDRPANSFALGYLAAGSAVELATEVAAAIAGRGQASTVVSTADLQALIAENQQLNARNTALAADVVALKAYAQQLEAWGDKMTARLNAKTG